MMMKHITEKMKALIKRTNQTLIELIAGILTAAALMCVVGLLLPIRWTFIAGVLMGSIYSVIMAVHMPVSIEDAP